jgi:hypothetical protein
MVINSGKSAALSSLRGVPKSVPVARQVGALAQDKSDENQRKLPHTLLVWLFGSPLSKIPCLPAILS